MLLVRLIHSQCRVGFSLRAGRVVDHQDSTDLLFAILMFPRNLSNIQKHVLFYIKSYVLCEPHWPSKKSLSRVKSLALPNDRSCSNQSTNLNPLNPPNLHPTLNPQPSHRETFNAQSTTAEFPPQVGSPQVTTPQTFPNFVGWNDDFVGWNESGCFCCYHCGFVGWFGGGFCSVFGKKTAVWVYMSPTWTFAIFSKSFLLDPMFKIITPFKETHKQQSPKIRKIVCRIARSLGVF